MEQDAKTAKLAAGTPPLARSLRILCVSWAHSSAHRGILTASSHADCALGCKTTAAIAQADQNGAGSTRRLASCPETVQSLGGLRAHVQPPEEPPFAVRAGIELQRGRGSSQPCDVGPCRGSVGLGERRTLHVNGCFSRDVLHAVLAAGGRRAVALLQAIQGAPADVDGPRSAPPPRPRLDQGLRDGPSARAGGPARGEGGPPASPVVVAAGADSGVGDGGSEHRGAVRAGRGTRPGAVSVQNAAARDRRAAPQAAQGHAARGEVHMPQSVFGGEGEEAEGVPGIPREDGGYEGTQKPPLLTDTVVSLAPSTACFASLVEAF